MTTSIAKAQALLEQIPHDLIALVARISVGTVFLRSGLLKLDGWKEGNTLALFKDEYRLPIIPPELAAYMATAAELALPPLLIAGLFTRYAALALLGMTLVIQIFVYPNAFDTHGVWAVCFLYLMKFGAGSLALDRFIGSGGQR
ncbi:MAG: DoxX family protein [Hyphomicrobiaceae bacterium]